LNREFWSGRRVLITGHTGFKGAWLSYWLAKLGAAVTGVALPPDTEPSLFRLLRLAPEVNSHFEDVTDLEAFRRLAQWGDPEVFFHLAAQAQVRDGYAEPVETFRTNVLGTVHALEVARDLPSLRALVIVTSDKCYRNDGRFTAYREDDRLGGDDPYSCSKACAELVAACYRKSYFEDRCAVATVRAGNVIGGGDWSRDRLVPDVVRAVIGGSRLKLRNPTATRPWQHVLEPLDGYAALAERLCVDGPSFAGAWNFGPESAELVTVADLAESILVAWDQEPRWKQDRSHSPAEAGLLVVDSSKARDGLGWRPRLSIAETVGWTAEWYRGWHFGDAPEELTRAQIDRYQRLQLPAVTPRRLSTDQGGGALHGKFQS
jgi:CDP-glucose 4,6-dehydratase